MRFLTIIVISFLIFISNFKVTFASFAPSNPGTYGCVWVPLLGCRVGNLSCSTGYRLPNPQFCQGLTSSNGCAGAQFPCQFIPPDGSGGGTGGGGPELISCSGGKGIETAIGCIPTLNENGQGLAQFFLAWGLGIAGGISTIMIVIASYIISTASGDPKKAQAGKELLTSAVSGLILLVFSAFILKIIGVDLLGVF